LDDLNQQSPTPYPKPIDDVVMPEIPILLNQDIREVFTSFLHYDIILASSYQVSGVI